LLESEKKVRLISQYRQSPDVFSPVMGSITSPSEDKILVGWGKSATNSLLTEFGASGQVKYSISLEEGSVSWSYKVSFTDSLENLFPLDADTLDFGALETGDSLNLEIVILNNSGYASTLFDISHGVGPFKVSNELPLEFLPGESRLLSVVFKASSVGSFSEPIYLKFRSDSISPGNNMVSSRLIAEGTSENTTGIKENFGNELLIYPNPFSGMVILENLSGVEEICFRQLDGKIVLIQKNMNNQLVINTDNLAPGFYFIALKFSDGHSDLKKLVKMK